MLEKTWSNKRFNPKSSAFHLFYIVDGKLFKKEFESLEELARFISAQELAWTDYGIFHGESVKDIPSPWLLNDDATSTFIDENESGIELAPREKLIEPWASNDDDDM